MASKEDYLKLMSEVRKVSGVDTLTPDETGLVSIRVDDAYNVNLQFVEATGKILCFVEVVQLPPDAPHNDESILNLYGRGAVSRRRRHRNVCRAPWRKSGKSILQGGVTAHALDLIKKNPLAP